MHIFVGMRVRLKESMWWAFKANRERQTIPAGAVGTIREYTIAPSDCPPRYTLGIDFDRYKHPRPGGIYGLSQAQGDELPAWLDVIEAQRSLLPDEEAL